MAPRCFRCERTPMTQPRFGSEVAMTYCSLPVLSCVNFFVKFFFETITNYTEFWKPQPLKNCRSLAVFIMSSTSGPFQFHTRWLRRSKYWLKNESTIDHIVHVKLTSFSLKMKAVFSQGCVFQRCVFSKVCFSKGVFLKGVLLSKGVFWNTPFWLKVCFLIKGVFTEHIFPQHISWMVC